MIFYWKIWQKMEFFCYKYYFFKFLLPANFSKWYPFLYIYDLRVLKPMLAWTSKDQSPDMIHLPILFGPLKTRFRTPFLVSAREQLFLVVGEMV